MSAPNPVLGPPPYAAPINSPTWLEWFKQLYVRVGQQSAPSNSGIFNNPMTTLGDIIYENATPAGARLSGNTSSTKKFLSQTGTGSVSASPAWNTIASSDVPTLNQNTTGTAAGLSATLPIASGGTGQITKAAAFDALQPMSAGGDLIYGGASGTGTRLANGTANQVLQSNGTTLAPTWTTNISGNSANVTGTVAIGNGGTGQTTKSAAFDALQPMTTGGDLIYGGASGTGTRLANGSAGQVLTSNGTTLAPSWQAAGSSSAVAASYYCSANRTTDTSTPVNYDTQIYDTNSAVTTGSGWKFTAPNTGYYRLSGTWATTTNTFTAISFYKNGSILYYMAGINSNNGGYGFFSQTVSLSATDYIDVRAQTSVTVQGGTLTGGNNAIISIEQVH